MKLTDKTSAFAIPFAVLAFGVFCRQPTQSAANYVQTGYQCLNLHDYAKAEGYFKVEIAINPNSVEAHFGLAKTLFLQKRQTEAAKELERVSLLDPKGTYGNQARTALANLHRVVASRFRPPTVSKRPTASRAPSSPMSNGLEPVRLTNGQMYMPCPIANMQPAWIREFNSLESDRQNRIAKERRGCEEYKQELIKQRDSFANGPNG